MANFTLVAWHIFGTVLKVWQ